MVSRTADGAAPPAWESGDDAGVIQATSNAASADGHGMRTDRQTGPLDKVRPLVQVPDRGVAHRPGLYCDVVERMRLTVNGAVRRVDGDPGRTLLTVLRDDLDLTGAKYGCGEAQCGACVVLLDGEPVPACVTPVGSA